MSQANLEVIDQFFAAYSNRDRAALQLVLADDATWTFPGHHPLSGMHAGIDAIVAFFDAMGTIMAHAQPVVEKLVVGANDQYVVECQQIHTNCLVGPNLSQQMCVVWRFANGKIVSGAHLIADQDAVDRFYGIPIQAAQE